MVHVNCNINIKYVGKIFKYNFSSVCLPCATNIPSRYIIVWKKKQFKQSNFDSLNCFVIIYLNLEMLGTFSFNWFLPNKRKHRPGEKRCFIKFESTEMFKKLSILSVLTYNHLNI